MSQIVTRFAPSPTGSLHVGGLRTALYNFVYAKKHGGKFILRIEDTDEVRSTDESLKGIVRDLKWAGIDWDEGPSKNENDLRNNQIGDNGPYFQSQRKDIYNKYIDQLLKAGLAYEKDDAIVFAMPKEDIVVKDVILGDITFPGTNCQDLVIRKSTGMPTFHFAVVIDDATMGVTHIIRGQEHLQNCWKHIALQKALGLPTPVYGHIPLIMNTDGSKMSKRQKTGQVNTMDFRQDGYLPEVMLNYLALLGWSPGDNVEKFDIDYMIEKFDIKDIGKSNARFDYKKLNVFNGDHIAGMDTDKFTTILAQYLFDFHKQFGINLTKRFTGSDGDKFIEVYKPRLKTLKDITTLAQFFLVHNVEYNQDSVDKILKKNNHEGLMILDEIYERLSNIEWNADNINKVINELAEEKKLSVGKIAQPIRVAVTGNNISPSIDDTLILLGREIALTRIVSCINMHKTIGV
jgi:glutamyl-tRNA synthetase